MKITAIQEQLNEVVISIQDADARRRAAANTLVHKPGDMEARKTLRELTAYIREMNDDKASLEFALAEARKQDQSDEALKQRQRARNLVNESILATRSRVKKAAAVDKAIANFGVAMRDLIAAGKTAESTAIEYLSVAHRGDWLRRGDHQIVFQSEARGDSYIMPAIGKALGQALQGFEAPNVPLRDWLCLNEGPGRTAEEAATLCADRYAPRIEQHLAHHIGSEEPSNEQN